MYSFRHRRTSPEPAVLRPGVPTWEAIAREHGRFLYSVAYRLSGNHDDAQDLVQEVMVRVQRGLATYEPGNLEGWLARITTNTFLDDRRRRARRPETALGDEPDRFLPAAPSPDEALAAIVLPDHVQAAIAALAPDFRAALVLCDVVGLPYVEIAEQLGVPVGTVRSRIHRARAQLREKLG